MLSFTAATSVNAQDASKVRAGIGLQSRIELAEDVAASFPDAAADTAQGQGDDA